MKHRKVIGIIVAAVLLACLATVPVTAQALPCQFKGTVTLDGNPVAAGTPITATLTDGTPVGSTTAYMDGMESKYNMIIPEELDAIVLTEGTALEFYVNGDLGGTSTWNAGATKTLNLEAWTVGEPDISVPKSSEGWSQSLMLLMAASFWAISWGPGIFLVGLVLFGLSDTVISIADTSVPDNEVTGKLT